jgi:7-keto-8-aminopelargonate synthetase-like enzyme
LDLKAASKEQALSANHSSEEQQEMEAMKTMIAEFTSQRESDLVKIQELEAQIADFTSNQFLRMDEDEESEEETEEEAPESPSPDQQLATPQQRDQSPEKRESPHLSAVSAKLDISDYTRQMEEVGRAAPLIPFLL